MERKKVTSPMKGDVVTDEEEIDGQSAGVSMQMDSRGATMENIYKGKYRKAAAIVLDGVAYSWPNVNTEIEMAGPLLQVTFCWKPRI